MPITLNREFVCSAHSTEAVMQIDAYQLHTHTHTLHMKKNGTRATETHIDFLRLWRLETMNYGEWEILPAIKRTVAHILCRAFSVI